MKLDPHDGACRDWLLGRELAWRDEAEPLLQVVAIRRAGDGTWQARCRATGRSQPLHTVPLTLIVDCLERGTLWAC